jgi:hypothetical protein
MVCCIHVFQVSVIEDHSIERPAGGQQAVMQVLQGSWDNTFSESSYGFRPGRSAHQWRVPSNILLRGTAGWSTSIWKSSLTELTTTD